MSTWGEDLYDVYAPEGAPWSAWVKPVLFATRPWVVTTGDRQATRFDVSWAPDPEGDSLVVVDLPGAQAVDAGIALAQRGFRPIPLFNGAPGINPVIPTEELVRALGHAGDVLRTLTLVPQARPVFLLDAMRRAPRTIPAPGQFDNRWMTFPQDFPSANLLLARGVRRVIVWNTSTGDRADDLAHVLGRWQDAGIELRRLVDGGGQPPLPYAASRPSGFRVAWYRALALLGVGRAAVGGFGARVPVPPQPGTGFYG